MIGECVDRAACAVRWRRSLRKELVSGSHARGLDAAASAIIQDSGTREEPPGEILIVASDAEVSASDWIKNPSQGSA